MELNAPAIAVVANTAWYLFNFRLNLMKSLQAAGYRVLAVAPADAYADRIRAAGIEFEPVAISGSGINPLKELGSVCRLHRLFRRQHLSLVISYTAKGNIYSALACRTLGLSFIPNVSGLGRTFIRRSPLTWLVQCLYRSTLPHAHGVFFQNIDDMRVFVRAGLVPPELAERLPGSGVDLELFRPAPFPRRPPDAPVFLLVARMLWDKGVGDYVAAARKVRTAFPNAEFRLLGMLDSDNPSAISRRQMEEWVATGVVRYLGVTDDVAAHLADADCVVLPSYREGVPRVLLEAAAMARPVITTDVPGCRDTVVHRKTGFLCRPADEQDLAEKMVALIALTTVQRQAMGRLGRALVERSFDERFVLARYHDVVAALVPEQTRLWTGGHMCPAYGLRTTALGHGGKPPSIAQQPDDKHGSQRNSPLSKACSGDMKN